MFHAVTVGAVDYNRNQVEDANLVAPEAVAKIIRDFVEFFFSCEECRQNFLKMYDSCAFGRCDRLTKVTKLTGEKDTELEWQAVSLWLYEVHNAVNVRLMNEKATREKRVSTLQDVVDVQFPSMRECRPCWLEPDAKGNRKWNETAVFNYLKLEYGQRDSYIVEFQRQLQEANSAADNDNQKLRAVGPKIAASQVLHPIILFVCIIGYIGFGGCGNIYWRRAFFQRKLRTL